MRKLGLVEQNIVPVSAFIASSDVFTTVGNNFASIGLSWTPNLMVTSLTPGHCAVG